MTQAILFLLLLPAALGVNIPISPVAPQFVQASVLPFPRWLQDFTGLRQWPGLDPPYIPLDFIDFSKIGASPVHDQGRCGGVGGPDCSFDCFNCVAPDDVYTCPRLSQTFDDGPTPMTSLLISELKPRSTFFTLGVNVVAYPEIYRQVVAKGHIVGSHTWSHKFLPALTNEQIIAQLEWSIWAMNATGGHLPKWFRPPYGGLDNRVRSIVRQFGMQNVVWNFDTFDWKLIANQNTEGEIAKNIDAFRAVNVEGLILEHDTTDRTVKVGLDISRKLPNQLTVPQCVGGIDYIKVFSK